MIDNRNQVEETPESSANMKDFEELFYIPQNYEVIEGQLQRYSLAMPGHNEWATGAKQCVDFLEGRQWSEEQKAILEDEGRPALTLNKMASLFRLLQGFFRQNKYDIKFLPGVDAVSTKEMSDILSAAGKQISEMNQGEWNDAEVFQDGMTGGRGFFDVRLDFQKNRLGDVKETVLDPFATIIDPEASTYNPEGWNYWMYSEWVSPVDIYLLHKAPALRELYNAGSNIPVLGNHYGQTELVTPPRNFGMDDFFLTGYDSMVNMYSSPFDHVNRHRKLVRKLDCQHRMLARVNLLVDMSTGAEVVIPETWTPEKIRRILQWAQSRNLPMTILTETRKRIRWTVTAGDRILFDDWSPYDEFTCVPYFPYFRRGQTRGMLHDLIDPQREINKRRSAFLHIVMTTANSGWISQENSMEEDMDRALEEEGARPGIHIKYKAGYDAPQRIQPVMPPNALRTLEEAAIMDLKEISGVNDAALGNTSNEKSGRAIQARQKQAIIGAEPYFDNFSRTRELKGRRYLYYIQNFYTEPRLVRLQGDAIGQPNDINVMVNRQEATGEITNNLANGKYDVAIDEAPMSSTFLQAQFQEAVELRRDLGIPIPDDIMVDLSSMPSKQVIKARMEEQTLAAQENMKIQMLMQRGGVGIPPNMPIPGVVTDGSPVIKRLSPEELAAQAATMAAGVGAGSPPPQPPQMPMAAPPAPGPNNPRPVRPDLRPI